MDQEKGRERKKKKKLGIGKVTESYLGKRKYITYTLDGGCRLKVINPTSFIFYT